MKQEKVSFRQLMALLWAGLLGPAAEWLPSMVTERAGPAGWLVPLLALPVLLAAGWLAGSLSRGAGGLSQGLMDSFGPGAGRAVLTIYIIWMELLLALRLRLSAQRMMAAGERDGALWFFLPVLVLMALWISWGKAGRLARTGELFFLLLAAAAAAVVGLALFQVKGENLYIRLRRGGERAGAGSGGVRGAVWPCAGPSWSSWGYSAPHSRRSWKARFFKWPRA